MSALENEVTAATATFEFFDRQWTVPTKRHLSHIKAMRDAMRVGYGGVDLMLAETFLSPADFDALLGIDPDEDALDEFTTKIAECLGLKSSGNSSPSSASS